MDLTDLTPAQQDALESTDLHTPSQEDMDWYISTTYVDVMERVW